MGKGFALLKAKREKPAAYSAKLNPLYLFFLPTYCSQMNPIEIEWHQVKAHELLGQMFEDELDLAYGVMSGVEARGIAGRHIVERFRFNSS